MQTFCELIANYCVKYKVIDAEGANALRFGIELIVTQVMTIGAILLIGIMISDIKQCLLFCICFVSSRKLFEGYHASTFLRCFVLTISFYLFVEMAIKLEIPYDLLNVVSCIMIYQSLKKHDEKRNKIILFTLFYSVCIIGFYLLEKTQYIHLYSLTLFLVLCLGNVTFGGEEHKHSSCG